MNILKNIFVQKEKKLHSPTLATVLMVEQVIKENGELISVADIKRKLPKQVMHQTLLCILDYLQYSGKIMIGTKGVLWVYSPREELNKLANESLEV